MLTNFDILDRAERLEVLAAELYAAFAIRFADDASAAKLFGRLREEEHQHAARVRMLAAQARRDGKLLGKIQADTSPKPENVAYMGDDWTDIPVLKKAGLACAPANALPEVKAAAHFVTSKEGGAGAVREVCDLILKSQGLWDTVMGLVEKADWPPLKKEPMKIVRHSKGGK